MIKIMFICHGNICRSPMAEFLMKDIVKKKNREKDFIIESSATSREEIGNPVHRGTREKLAQYGISVKGKTAKMLNKLDYNRFDYLICMDRKNIKNALSIIGEDKEKKLFLLSEFYDEIKDVADPWYTGDFDATFRDIQKGCLGLINKIERGIV